MKKLAIPVVASLLVLLILFFPVKKTHVISGHGEILTTEKEKVGDCSLSVEITEMRSLLLDYSRTFSFAINGKPESDFEAHSFGESDEISSITQVYYNEAKDQVGFCELVYPKDLSYVVFLWDDLLYFLPNGTALTASEIPWSIG